MKVKVQNPDKNKPYWHYCLKCKTALVHCTKVLINHMETCKYKDYELLTFPADVDVVEIQIKERGELGDS
jgi:hypothetical protein